jgi:hypothetical protein
MAAAGSRGWHGRTTSAPGQATRSHVAESGLARKLLWRCTTPRVLYERSCAIPPKALPRVARVETGPLGAKRGVRSIQELAAGGVRFVAITQNIDTDEANPAACILLHMFAAFAEFERELILHFKLEAPDGKGEYDEGHFDREVHSIIRRGLSLRSVFASTRG